jgi:hypothetical protein
MSSITTGSSPGRASLMVTPAVSVSRFIVSFPGAAARQRVLSARDSIMYLQSQDKLKTADTETSTGGADRA